MWRLWFAKPQIGLCYQISKADRDLEIHYAVVTGIRSYTVVIQIGTPGTHVSTSTKHLQESNILSLNISKRREGFLPSSHFFKVLSKCSDIWLHFSFKTPQKFRSLCWHLWKSLAKAKYIKHTPLLGTISSWCVSMFHFACEGSTVDGFSQQHVSGGWQGWKYECMGVFAKVWDLSPFNKQWSNRDIDTAAWAKDRSHRCQYSFPSGGR